jgi:hypothetical protein
MLRGNFSDGNERAVFLRESPLYRPHGSLSRRGVMNGITDRFRAANPQYGASQLLGSSALIANRSFQAKWRQLQTTVPLISRISLSYNLAEGKELHLKIHSARPPRYLECNYTTVWSPGLLLSVSQILMLFLSSAFLVFVNVSMVLLKKGLRE